MTTNEEPKKAQPTIVRHIHQPFLDETIEDMVNVPYEVIKSLDLVKHIDSQIEEEKLELNNLFKNPERLITENEVNRIFDSLDKMQREKVAIVTSLESQLIQYSTDVQKRIDNWVVDSAVRALEKKSKFGKKGVAKKRMTITIKKRKSTSTPSRISYPKYVEPIASKTRSKTMAKSKRILEPVPIPKILPKRRRTTVRVPNIINSDNSIQKGKYMGKRAMKKIPVKVSKTSQRVGKRKRPSRSKIKTGGIKTLPAKGKGNADDEIYCFCNRKSYGNMIACDNKQCERKWFHFGCVGIGENERPENFLCINCKNR